jgi:hypothetical protein
MMVLPSIRMLSVRGERGDVKVVLSCFQSVNESGGTLHIKPDASLFSVHAQGVGANWPYETAAPFCG